MKVSCDAGLNCFRLSTVSGKGMRKFLFVELERIEHSEFFGPAIFSRKEKIGT